MVVFGLLSPTFLSRRNFEILAKQTAINAILAIGMTFVILTGGIDLSVGSIVGLTGDASPACSSTRACRSSALGVIVYPHTWMVLVISLAAGALVGAINGFIITRFNVAPFIATLGMLYVARGAGWLLNNGNTFPNLVGARSWATRASPELGTGELLGISWAIWIMVAFAAGGLVRDHADAVRPSRLRDRRQRALGRAVGRPRQAHQDDRLHDQRLLRRHGRPDHRLAARRRPPGHRRLFELNAIAAVVLGGTSLAGGRGTIVGTLIGAFVIGVLTVGLTSWASRRSGN